MTNDQPEKLLSLYLQQLLRDRGLDHLKQKPLWQRLNLKKRSAEWYRKVFYEGTIPNDLNDLDEIATALNEDPIKLQAIAYAQKAPPQLQRPISEGLIRGALHGNDIAPNVIWNRERLRNHVKALYEIEGFKCQTDYREGRFSCDLYCRRDTRLEQTVHAIWIALPPDKTSLFARNALLSVKDAIKHLSDIQGTVQDLRLIHTGQFVQAPDLPARVKVQRLADFQRDYFAKGDTYLTKIYDLWQSNDASKDFHELTLAIEVRGGVLGPHEERLSNVVFQEWLRSDSPLLLLNGPFGTGKTTLMQELAFRLAEAFFTQPSAWYPILLNMRDYREFKWDELATQVLPAFLRDELKLIDSAHNWPSFLANGPFVIILEGLDEYELSFSPRDRADLAIQLRALLESTSLPGGMPTKIVISTRTEMFVSDEDIYKYFSAVRDSYWQAKILPLPPRQREAFLRSAVKIGAGENQQVQTSRLADVSAIIDTIGRCEEARREKEDSTTLDRPLFLRMIAENWETFHPHGTFDVFEMHKGIVDRWATREVDEKKRDQLTANDKREFIRYLARRGEIEGRGFRLDYGKIPRDICEYFDAPNPQALDAKLEHEVRVSSFIERNSQGEYFFRYTSFAQFCSAEAIADELGRAPDIHWRLPDPAPAKPGKFALRNRSTFGRNRIADRADSVFLGFLERFRQFSWDLTLVDILNRSRQPTFSKFNGNRFSSPNALFLLSRISKGQLSQFQKDWSGLYIGDANLTTYLQAALPSETATEQSRVISFRGCDLSGSYFGRSTFPEADFRDADLTYTWFHDCNIPKATFSGPDQISKIIVTGNCRGEFFDGVRNAIGGPNPADFDYEMSKRILQICPDGFACFPGGQYTIGLDDAGGNIEMRTAIPSATIEIDPLFIQSAHVTNAQFNAFAQSPENRQEWGNIAAVNKRFDIPYFLHHWDTNINAPRGKEPSPHDGPAVWTNFYSAFAYAAWHGARIPTESEYEAARIAANIEPALKAAYETEQPIRTTPPEAGDLKAAMLTKIKEWCFDFWNEHLDIIKKQRTNPRVDETLDYRDESSLAASGERRVIRGSGEKRYQPPQLRESMVITNVNPDIGFRIVREVWHIASKAAKEERK
jgi:formylglycine-generating enzyme required for sulfatase activity